MDKWKREKWKEGGKEVQKKNWVQLENEMKDWSLGMEEIYLLY